MLEYQALVYNNGQYILQNRWVWPVRDSNGTYLDNLYSDIANGKSVTKEATFNVPADYNSALWIALHMDIDFGQSSYPYSVSNYSVNLVNDDDFGIKSITLPSGTVINSNTYTDTLTNNGTYTYSVLDSRGQTTKKTVTVNIDKTAPTMNITGAPTTAVNHDVPLTVTTADTGGSDVSQIQSPTGEWSNNSTLSYTANQEGNHTYTFGVKDNAGNVTDKSVTINIDKTAPTFDDSTDDLQTVVHHNETLHMSATDDNSGVDAIQTPDGIWNSGSNVNYTVDTNGNYTFKVRDKAGNITTKTISVQNIYPDKYIQNSNKTTVDNQTEAQKASLTSNILLNGKQQFIQASSDDWLIGNSSGDGWTLSVMANALSNGTHTINNAIEMKAPSYTGGSLSNLLGDGYQTISTNSTPVYQNKPTTFTWNNDSGLYYLRVNSYVKGVSKYNINNIKLVEQGTTTNLMKNSNEPFIPQGTSIISAGVDNYNYYKDTTVNLVKGKTYTLSADSNGVIGGNHNSYILTDGTDNHTVIWLSSGTSPVDTSNFIVSDDNTGSTVQSRLKLNDGSTYRIKIPADAYVGKYTTQIQWNVK